MSEAAGPPTFFEGPEKKFELLAAPDAGPLRALDPERWHAVAEAAGAQVLSHLRSPACDAWILSESSLFVFDHRALMITCGQSRLVDGLLAALELVPREHVRTLFYERKNEYFPERQPTTFRDDCRVIAARLPGEAWRFGGPDAPHVYLFVSATAAAPDPDDVTLEVLMHNLDEPVARRFRALAGREADGRLAAELGITRILPGFRVDEHVFTPTGYSLNALQGSRYYTVHVTPERPGSYVSFETNVDFRPDPAGLVRRLTEVFRPRSLILVGFAPEPLPPFSVPDRDLLDRVETRAAGHHVSFTSWYRQDPSLRHPAPIHF